MKYFLIALTIAAIIVSVRILPHILALLSPLIVALIIAIPSQRLVRFLERKCKINRSLGSAFIVLLIIFVIGGILWYLISQFVREMQDIIDNIPETIEQFRLHFDNISYRYMTFLDNLPI